MKWKEIAVFLLTGILLLTGCGLGNTGTSGEGTGENTTTAAKTTTQTTTETATGELSNGIDTSDMFTDRDKEIGYDEENSAVITL